MFKHLMYCEADSNPAILAGHRRGCWMVALCEDDFGFTSIDHRAFTDAGQAREFYDQLPHSSTFFSHSRYADPHVRRHGLTIHQYKEIGAALYCATPSQRISNDAAFAAYAALLNNLLGENK